MKILDKSTVFALFLSPLVVVAASPIYGFFLSYIYGSGFNLEIAITVSITSGLVALVASYILLPTYGLFIFYFLNKFNSKNAFLFLVAGAIPSLIYHQFFNSIIWESLVPGLYFGGVVALSFWWLVVHRTKQALTPHSSGTLNSALLIQTLDNMFIICIGSKSTQEI